MPAITQQEKAERYDREQEKSKVRKAQEKLKMYRAVEFSTAFGSGLLLGALNKAKPEFSEVAYGIVQPNVVAATLGVIGFLAAGKNENLREASAGLAFGGGIPLAHMGGAKLYALIAGE